MPPTRGNARGRGRPSGNSRGRGRSLNIPDVEVEVTAMGVHAEVEAPTRGDDLSEPEHVNHVDTMLADIRPRGGTLQVKPWCGGRGFGEFKRLYEQQSLGAGWPRKEQVLRLIGYLGDLPASKYMAWLKAGKLLGVSLEAAFRMLSQEFFDEEDEKLSACEIWRSRKQKPDESIDEYHSVFVANADKAGTFTDKELLRQWGRNVVPAVRATVQAAAVSNLSLTFQSGVRIARDVHTALLEEEPSTAYKRRNAPEDMGEDMAEVRRIRAIASNTSEMVIKSMELEISQIRRDLQRSQERVKSMEAAQEARWAPPERMWKPRGRGRGGYQQRETPASSQACSQCGSRMHTTQHCNFDGQCFNCGKRGHKSPFCKKRKEPEVGEAREEPKEPPHPKDK